MRLPYLQLASEVVDRAGDLAVLLDWDEAKAGWGLVKLFDWALGRCREDLPPSQSDTLRGPTAAKLVAKVAGWSGDPDLFIDACAELPESPIQRVEGGIRICGLKRYDAAWGKNHPEEWKRFRNETVPKPERNRSETVPEPEQSRSETARKTHTQTQIETHKEETRTYVANVPTVPEKPTKPDELWDGMDFRNWAQAKRLEEGLAVEGRCNEREVSAWFSARLQEGFAVKDLRNGFYAFADDPYWKDPARAPALPFKGFLRQWDRFVTRAEVRHAS